MIIEDEDEYLHHIYDIGRKKQNLNIPVKRNATIKKQKLSNIIFYLRDKFERLIHELISAGRVRDLKENDDKNSVCKFCNNSAEKGLCKISIACT